MSSLLKQYAAQLLEKASEGKIIPNFAAGDEIDVTLRHLDGATERTSIFRGICLSRSKSGITSNCIVRQLVGSIAVEKRIMFFSPLVESIKIVKLGAVRRAKIFYIRDLVGRRARIPEDRSVRAIRRKNATAKLI